MSVTPEIEADILRIHGLNPKRFSPFRASKTVGATVEEVMAVVRRHSLNTTESSEHSGGVGRAELEPYIVASRRINDRGWENTDPGVHRARLLFEAGTHDMATHRDGAWLHLCSIPLSRHRKPRPGYFTGRPLA